MVSGKTIQSQSEWDSGVVHREGVKDFVTKLSLKSESKGRRVKIIF